MSLAAPIEITQELLESASEEELRAIARQLEEAKAFAVQIGPQTDEELHAFIKEKWGIHVPRVAVTEGMSSPFQFIADIYFFRENSVIGIANREGAKTSSVALIHALFANFFPGYEGISAGAIEEQTKRVYGALKQLNRKWGQDNIAETQATQIRWKNDSIVEPKVGTDAQMNGPHSFLLHRDEIEQFRRSAFNEADNITKSGKTADGRKFPAIDVYTTSRKKARGLLQEMIDRVDEAKKNGSIPPYKIYIWGVAETIENQPNCRQAPQNVGRPDEELCNCHRYINGKMPDGTPRSLEKICGGRFFKSDGWRPREPDIAGKFMANSPAMWDAQQECKKPATEGLILADFSKETHGITNFVPNPEDGKIYQSADFGGKNPHSSHLYQYTDRPVLATGFSGNPVFIPQDSYIVFGEVYIAEVGNNVFAQMIKNVEANYRKEAPFLTIDERYADVAARAARIDFKQTHGLKTVWRVTREINEHIKIIQQLVSQNRIFVCHTSSPMWCEEAEAWQWDDSGEKQLDTFNHSMAEARYAIANIERKLLSEKKHPTNRNTVVQAGPAIGETPSNPLSMTPNTGPAIKTYMSGSPHDSEDFDRMPIHQGPLAMSEDRMYGP